MWNVSDETLLAGLGSGDPDAAAVFVRRFQRRVFGLTLSVLRDRGAAEEAAQESFVRNVSINMLPGRRFDANAYGTRSMYALALALGCDETQIASEIAARSGRRQKPQLVDSAPCKDVILKGEDVDLTILPLFVGCARRWERRSALRVGCGG